MRGHDNELAPDEVEPWFVDDGDAENPGTVVECTECHLEQFIPYPSPEEPKCAQCHKTFVYRSWWSW